MNNAVEVKALSGFRFLLLEEMKLPLAGLAELDFFDREVTGLQLPDGPDCKVAGRGLPGLIAMRVR